MSPVFNPLLIAGCSYQTGKVFYGDVSKVGYFFDIPDEFKIKSLYSNDLILNIAVKSKETVQKLKFLDSPVPAAKYRAFGEKKQCA